VVYVAEIASGIDDTEVLRQAQAEGRLLLTEDKGFSDLVFRSEMAVPGIVLLRISPVRQVLKWTRLEAAVGQFGERLLGRYLVIEEARLRSRPLLRSLRA